MNALAKETSLAREVSRALRPHGVSVQVLDLSTGPRTEIVFKGRKTRLDLANLAPELVADVPGFVEDVVTIVLKG